MKLVLYRDQCPVDWQQVVAHPLKVLLWMLLPLCPCDDPSCEGLCECWHPAEKAVLSDPLMEVWGRQWLSAAFSHVPATEAEMFSLHVRLPRLLQTLVQTYSGVSGLFTEPRTEDGRQASDQYHVVWTPRADISSLLMQKQTRPTVLGIARVGSKLGLRCRAADAAKLFAELRPGSIYLPAGRKASWLVGPFPFGTLKTSVADTLRDAGWIARPLQTQSAHKHISGVLYRVQSVTEPPSRKLSMAHGDVLVTRIDEEKIEEQTSMQIVGSARKRSMVSTSHQGVDMLQINDPWARAKGVVAQQVGGGSPDVVGDLEEKITAAVVARLDKGKDMEVDEHDDEVAARVSQLEAQMHDMQVQQAHMGEALQRQGQEHTAQVNQLHASLQSQRDQLERTLHSNVVSFQEQFAQQERNQEALLNSMFGKQMEQLEALLAKRPRTE